MSHFGIRGERTDPMLGTLEFGNESDAKSLLGCCAAEDGC